MFGYESESGRCKVSDHQVLLNGFSPFMQLSTIASVLDDICRCVELYGSAGIMSLKVIVRPGISDIGITLKECTAKTGTDEAVAQFEPNMEYGTTVNDSCSQENGRVYRSVAQ